MIAEKIVLISVICERFSLLRPRTLTNPVTRYVLLEWGCSVHTIRKSPTATVMLLGAMRAYFPLFQVLIKLNNEKPINLSKTSSIFAAKRSSK